MSDEQHPHRLEILAFIEGVSEADDNDAIAAHLQRCTKCFHVYEALTEALGVLADGEVASHIEDEDDAAADFLRGLLSLEEDAESAEREALAADALFVQLAQEPVDRWEAIIGAHPNVCTGALVQRLVDAATPELDRKPDHALVLLRIAELVAFALHEDASLRWRGHVWKQRSNALRMLARYEEAVDAAIVAENLFSSLREPDTQFEVGQARYTMAVTLWKMTRYRAARQTLRSARELLEEYGESAPLAKVLMLDALIQIEEGDVAAARDVLRELLPIEERLGQHVEIGRVRTNLAECNLRLGDFAAGEVDALAAREIFHNLGNVAEQTRSEWTLVMIQIARGDETDVRAQLDHVASTYRALGMPGEVGFVSLDVAELLLRNEDWTEAEILSRQLVAFFVEAGVTIASINALDYLRRAVENREATADMIRYVRDYVAADDPERAFEPPRTLPS
jgi:tetratricopeptide (TPR) repeat protein